MLSLRNDGVWKHFTQLFHVSTREAINKTPCPIFHTTYKCDYQDLRRAVFQVTSQDKNGAAGKWNNHQDNYFLLKHAQLRETATVPCALSPRQQHIKKEKQLKKKTNNHFFFKNMSLQDVQNQQLQRSTPNFHTCTQNHPFHQRKWTHRSKGPSMRHCWRMFLLQIQGRVPCYHTAC